MQSAPLPTGKMLRPLVALGLADSVDETFGMPEAVVALFDPEGHDITPILLHSHAMAESFGAHLENWVRTGDWPRPPRTDDDIAASARRCWPWDRTWRRRWPILSI